jgi:hypothetical protein
MKFQYFGTIQMMALTTTTTALLMHVIVLHQQLQRNIVET